jgi:phosphatidylethanolamine N-methyltransferase
MTGYAWIYGISLIVGSYPVLFVSLAAHCAQFAFLVFFENPRKYRGVLNFIVSDSDPLALDIERFYGQPKLLAQRVPIPQPLSLANGSANVVPQVRSSLQGQGETLARARAFSAPPSTSSATEGLTACDSETESDAELDSQQTCINEGIGSTKLSRHDLRNRYFRKDTIVLSHLDVFRCASFTRGEVSGVLKPSSFNRSQDFMLLLAMGYALLTSVLPTRLLTNAGLHFGHALAWTVFHTLCLGLVLHAQSTRKFLVRHFLQHYHYPARDLRRGAVREAFASWKAVYNLSMCMSYGLYFLISLFQR